MSMAQILFRTDEDMLLIGLGTLEEFLSELCSDVVVVVVVDDNVPRNIVV